MNRWGQSSLLLQNPSTTTTSPVLAILSGKSYVAGQTVDSTPSTSSTLLLDLSQPISDLANAPWVASPANSNPVVSYSSAFVLSASQGLMFGGDGSGDSLFPVQTRNDSSWLFSLSSRSSSAATAASSTALLPSSASFTHEPASWASQPQRRLGSYTASYSNGTHSIGFLYGGVRADGSLLGFSELWQFTAELSNTGDEVDTTTARWTLWNNGGAAVESGTTPPAMYDGVAVLVPSESEGEAPSIYLIGGVQVEDGVTSLASLSTIWVFTPSSGTGRGSNGGRWSQILTTSPPSSSRSLTAVHVGQGRIWVYGGRSLDGAEVLGESSILDTATGTWEAMRSSAVGGEGWGSSAVMVGETVVLAFGYGLDAPLSNILRIYCPGNDTWLSAYVPSYSTTSPISPGNIIANPKATSTATAGVASGTGTASSGPGTGSGTSNPGSGSSSSSSNGGTNSNGNGSGNSGSNGSGSSSGNSNNNNSGGRDGNTGSDSPNSSGAASDEDDGESSGPSGKVIAGSVVGGLAIVIGAIGAAVVMRRRRRRRGGGGRYYGGGGYSRYGHGGGWRRGSDEGSGSLMAEQSFGGGDDGGEAGGGGPRVARRKLAVVGGGTAGGERVGKAITGLWARRRITSGPRRFDMLHDEESEKWPSESTRGAPVGMEDFGERHGGGSGVGGGWTMFKGEDGEEEDRSDPSVRGRGGLDIWNGFDTSPVPSSTPSPLPSTGGIGGAGGVGLNRHNSFLTTALGAFSPSARPREFDGDLGSGNDMGMSSLHLAEYQAPPPIVAEELTPIVEDWESSHADSSSQDHTYESGNTTRSSIPTMATTSFTSSPTKSSTAIERSISPPEPVRSSSLLYGSSFDQMTGATREQPAASDVKRQTTWFNRLSKPSTSGPSSQLGHDRIRDPTPAPSTVSFDTRGPDQNPFSDSAAGKVDEQGRRLEPRGVSEGSLSTIESFQLEEAMRNLDVVQRAQTPSQSGSLSSAAGGSGSYEYGDLSSSRESGDVVWSGAEVDVEGAGAAGGRAGETMPARGMTSSPDPFTDNNKPTPTTTPTRRLVSFPPIPSLPNSTSPGTSPIASHRRPGGVKAMVQQFERKSSMSGEPTSPSSSGAALPRSASSGHVRKATMEFDRPRVVSTGSVVEKDKVVRHGLARKPVLYVANPDAEKQAEAL